MQKYIKSSNKLIISSIRNFRVNKDKDKIKGNQSNIEKINTPLTFVDLHMRGGAEYACIYLQDSQDQFSTFGIKELNELAKDNMYSGTYFAIMDVRTQLGGINSINYFDAEEQPTLVTIALGRELERSSGLDAVKMKAQLNDLVKCKRSGLLGKLMLDEQEKPDFEADFQFNPSFKMMSRYGQGYYQLPKWADVHVGKVREAHNFQNGFALNNEKL